MLKKILIPTTFLTLFFCSFSSRADEAQLQRMIEAQANLLNQYQAQLIELQSDVDTLRGEVQRNTHQLNSLLQNKNGSNSATTPIATTDSTTTAASNSANNESTTVTPKTNTTSSAASSTGTLVNWTPSGDDKADYNQIIKFVLADKERAPSIDAFKLFIDTYPKSTYLSNANFWLGQLNYNQGNKEDASFYFATVVKNHPNSNKAGMSLAKIGQILEDKNDKAKAKLIYQQVLSQYSKQQDAVNFANKRLKGL